MVSEPRQTLHVTVQHGQQRLVTVEQVREHLGSDLPTSDELQRLIDEADAEVVRRYGPHKIDGSLTDVLRGGADLDALTIATVRSCWGEVLGSVPFRTGAHDAATRLSVWAWSPEGVAQAQKADLTVMRVSDVRQLDDVVSEACTRTGGASRAGH